MATRLSGSSDLYQSSGRHPYHSINFITSHDGYTLGDLVSYERKHNQANGEGNRDGENNNYSSNYGVEGPTRKKHIVELRRRQVKNMMAALLLSEGTPMIVAGDEVLRTQRGNNNAYCQDNPTSWFDWRLLEKNAEMFRFIQALIAFRKGQPNVRRDAFLTGRPPADGQLPDVSWFGPDGHAVNWTAPSRSLTCALGTAGLDDPAARYLLILLHAGSESQEFVIPANIRRLPWRLLLDTAGEAPADIFPDANGPPLPPGARTKLPHHSMRVYVA
jgi:glycogen operon protein